MADLTKVQSNQDKLKSRYLAKLPESALRVGYLFLAD